MLNGCLSFAFSPTETLERYFHPSFQLICSSQDCSHLISIIFICQLCFPRFRGAANTFTLQPAIQSFGDSSSSLRSITCDAAPCKSKIGLTWCNVYAFPQASSFPGPPCTSSLIRLLGSAPLQRGFLTHKKWWHQKLTPALRPGYKTGLLRGGQSWYSST